MFNQGLNIKKDKKQAGFSLLEVLLMIGLAGLAGLLTIQTVFSFFQDQSLDEAGRGAFGALRRAREQAFFQKNDSPFGVKFLPSAYVLFEGSAYLTRNQLEDEVFTLSQNISLSGADEVVFSKGDGLTSEASLILSSGKKSITFSINSQGRIERQ